MFFVLLRADRYASILEADGGFELFPINGPPQLSAFRASFLQDAGMRGGVLPRARANSSRPAIITAPPTMITSVVLGGIKRESASKGQTPAGTRHKCGSAPSAFARRAFRGVSSDAVYRIPHSGAVPPTLSFQMPVQQSCGFSVHGGVIVVAYLKKIHVLLRFEIGSLRVPENSIHSISTATGQSDML